MAQKKLARMESQLASRDRVGVQDFVLLEDYLDEGAFINNLQKRFYEGIIYTYIGSVLISVNPYKELGIYSQEYLKKYINVNFFEVPPHVFALTDLAYNNMREEFVDQCILISGESGSGKTEASKKVLQYIAAASGNLRSVVVVKDKLLQSNPLLEAFGNAKTQRNDNSSRFGKYMDVEFNFKGDPTGGHILNYLLEKSRVLRQTEGERNFHIFYQLLIGGDDELLSKLRLKRNISSYKYLSQGEKPCEDINDAAQFGVVRSAMSVIDIPESDQFDMLAIVACVLHLGNVKFIDDGQYAKVKHEETVQTIAELLKCPTNKLIDALTHRTIEARGEVVCSTLDPEKAAYARDALAKAMYDRLFTWLVQAINSSLVSTEDEGRKVLMGILDIYGFEIFDTNSFEQFCINYCNEKLQQLFVELTLKSEQEEYLKEGIEWEPVEYFNNKPICDLIEEMHKGIISLLDEECLRPGECTDKSFLDKLILQLHSHNHFVTLEVTNRDSRRTLKGDEFRLRHYAGDVTYNVNGFLDKNNNLLFRDLKEVMTCSHNVVINAMFPASELLSKKRPETAATQFKVSVNALMAILLSKEPSYIRCIKPNETKSATRFDVRVVGHQVKYLGLMENVRVRRAGFCYRRIYEGFLTRYKSLSSDTWPHWHGTPKDGVQKIIDSLEYSHDDYRMGKTKIFIRFPKTVFDIEDTFQRRKNELATLIQKVYRGLLVRRRFVKMRVAAIIFQKNIRRYLAKRQAKRRREAVLVLRKYIYGFIHRNNPNIPEGVMMSGFVKQTWLKRLPNKLPKTVLDKTWPKAPPTCEKASDLLRPIYYRHLVRLYMKALTEERKEVIERKILAETIFRGRKASYKKSVPVPFKTSRLSSETADKMKNIFETKIKLAGEKTTYATTATKYDRHGYKPRARVLIITDQAVYLLDAKDFKKKHRIPLGTVKGVCTTNLNDQLMLIRIPQDLKKDKGDLILDCANVIEACVWIAEISNNPKIIKVDQAETICHYMTGGKTGTIDVNKGTNDHINISKAKNGHLSVVASA